MKIDIGVSVEIRKVTDKIDEIFGHDKEKEKAYSRLNTLKENMQSTNVEKQVKWSNEDKKNVVELFLVQQCIGMP